MADEIKSQNPVDDVLQKMRNVSEHFGTPKLAIEDWNRRNEEDGE